MINSHNVISATRDLSINSKQKVGVVWHHGSCCLYLSNESSQLMKVYPCDLFLIFINVILFTNFVPHSLTLYRYSWRQATKQNGRLSKAIFWISLDLNIVGNI